MADAVVVNDLYPSGTNPEAIVEEAPYFEEPYSRLNQRTKLVHKERDRDLLWKLYPWKKPKPESPE